MKTPMMIRLKQLIKEHGMTQQGFYDKFAERYYPDGDEPGWETFRKWLGCQSNPSNLVHLANICDYFHVSMDYLFGRSDFRTPENEYICETTGLSEDAVNRIRELSYVNVEYDYHPYEGYLPHLNNVLECDEFWKYLDEVDRYKKERNRWNNQSDDDRVDEYLDHYEDATPFEIARFRLDEASRRLTTKLTE